MQFRMSVCALAALVSLCGRGASASDAPGAVYALTNDPAGNAVLVYDRAADGSLTAAGAYATGGAGSAAGLGSQGAVIVSDDRRWLFAANTGSNSISSFRIHPHGLELVDTESSGGTMPTSVAFRQGLLYVLNAGVESDRDFQRWLRWVTVSAAVARRDTGRARGAGGLLKRDQQRRIYTRTLTRVRERYPLGNR
jgi:hypothetical protein